MIRGTLTENPVLAALLKKSFFWSVFKCGMLGMGDQDWFACSSDAIAVINPLALGFTQPRTEGDGPWLNETAVATVEIKTCVAASSLDKSIEKATVDVVTCSVGDEIFQRYVPESQMGQILHQFEVAKPMFVNYISASESGLLYICVIRGLPGVILHCEEAPENAALPAVQWAHEENG